MNTLRQSQLETSVMAALLAGDAPLLATLRRQYEKAEVVERRFSGVGFFTTFAVPADLPKAHPASFHTGDIVLEITKVPAGAMAILFVSDGLLDYLEVVTFDGAWPDDAELVGIKRASA